MIVKIDDLLEQYLKYLLRDGQVHRTPPHLGGVCRFINYEPVLRGPSRVFARIHHQSTLQTDLALPFSQGRLNKNFQRDIPFHLTDVLQSQIPKIHDQLFRIMREDVPG